MKKEKLIWLYDAGVRVLSENSTLVKLEGVWKVYQTGKLKYPALRGVTLTVKEGEMLAVMGPSGSGKSTLLNIIGALDRPTKGRVFVNGHELTTLDDHLLARFRRKTVGFVFQTFNLIPRLTALENVEVPMVAEGLSREERRKSALELLKLVGLEDKHANRPNELSGGEQQRVAIARALANNPKLILADEPTGNLDTRNKVAIMQLLKKLNKQHGVTLIVVTHDPEVARMCERIVYLKDGRIEREEALTHAQAT